MKTIKVGEHNIELNVGEALTVKEFRKIYPIIKENEKNEIEMVIGIVKAFAVNLNVEEIIDALSISDFTELSKEVVGLIDQKKK